MSRGRSGVAAVEVIQVRWSELGRAVVRSELSLGDDWVVAVPFVLWRGGGELRCHGGPVGAAL